MTQYKYDALNQLLQTVDPLGGQTNFTYDGNGNLLTVQDANTRTTTYTPNSMDRVASRKDAGNPSVFVDRKKQVASNTYDGLHRLTQIQYVDLSTTTYTYAPETA